MRRMLTAGILVCLLCVMALSMPAMASQDGLNTLTIYYHTPTNATGPVTPIPNVTFALYQVAAGDASASSLTEKFAGFDGDLTWDKADSYDVIADGLKKYIADNTVFYDHVGVTGPDGKLIFTELPAGLYLVLGDEYKVGGITYQEPKPILVWLPQPELEYPDNVLAEPKPDHTQEPTPPPEETPTPPPGSTPTPTPGLTPTPTPLPTPPGTNRPWPTTPTPQPIPTKPPDKIPQTGQLWWPVPLLVAGGLALLAVGIVLKLKEDNRNE